MIEDVLLILRFKYGSRDALRRIYDKYRDYLLKLAIALINDVNVAEDIVHEVFLKFAQSENKIRIKGSLKGYLRTCVVNSARNKARARHQRKSIALDEVVAMVADSNKPDYWIICKEESKRISNALAQIPFEQREVVILHLHGDMKFKAIADLQGTSIKTVQSRYRYGLDKLRVLLDIKVEE
jgi:RNA polymerase sigma factor (sigma-70 family)